MEAIFLWDEVRTQWRASGAGLIGLDYGAVKIEAVRYDIALSNSVMSKIKALEREVLSRQMREGADV